VVSRRALSQVLGLPHALMQRCLSREEWALIVRAGMQSVAGTGPRATSVDAAQLRGIGPSVQEDRDPGYSEMRSDGNLASEEDRVAAGGGGATPVVTRQGQPKALPRGSVKAPSSRRAARDSAHAPPPVAADDAFVRSYRAFLGRTLASLAQGDGPPPAAPARCHREIPGAAGGGGDGGSAETTRKALLRLRLLPDE
jgi:hypothetical protein